MDLNIDSIIEMLRGEKEDFSDGDLVLIIACRRCDANFELSRASIALALMGNLSVWDYIKYIQHSTCPVCNKKEIESPNGTQNGMD